MSINSDFNIFPLFSESFQNRQINIVVNQNDLCFGFCDTRLEFCVSIENLPFEKDSLPIFDLERMLIELVRYKSKIPFNYYKEILGNYRRILPKLNTEKIRDYAEAMPKRDKIIRTLMTEVY